MTVCVNDIITWHLDPASGSGTGRQSSVDLLCRDLQRCSVSPWKETRSFTWKLMLSEHSQVSREGRVVGAQPKLWSITSEIAVAASHWDRTKERERQRENRRHQKHFYVFFPNILFEWHKLINCHMQHQTCCNLYVNIQLMSCHRDRTMFRF